MRCPKIHRYVIALATNDSAVYNTPEEARDFMKTLPEGSTAIWVAFHEVGVKILVDNPNTIETYCFQESNRLETEDLTADEQLTIALDEA